MRDNSEFFDQGHSVQASEDNYLIFETPMFILYEDSCFIKQFQSKMELE